MSRNEPLEDSVKKAVDLVKEEDVIWILRKRML